MIFKEKYLSEILNLPVLDKEGERVGSLKDVIANVEDDFPKMMGLVVLSKKAKDLILPWESLSLVTKKFISLNILKKDLKTSLSISSQLWLVKDVLDKQIIDTHGCKLVRVNDLKLAQIGEEVRLIAADIGIRGILRRLSLEKYILSLIRILGFKLKENLLSWNYLEPITSQVAPLKLTVSHNKLQRLHPSDIAQIISQLGERDRVSVFNGLNLSTAAETLHELEPEMQASLVEDLTEEKASDLLEMMPSDERADVLGDLPEEKTQELLKLMEKEEAEEVQELMRYDDDTAGGMMATEFIVFSQNLTAEEVITKLRELAPSAETIYYLYVVDEEKRLIGVLSLRDLIVANPQTSISEIMHTKVIKVGVDMPRYEVAQTISKYNFLALPVVDKEDHIVGIITVDDALDVVLPPSSRKKRGRMK